MNLKKLRAVKAQAAPSDQLNLKTTEIKTGKVVINGPFESKMLKAWIEKNAGGSVLSYQMVPA